MRALPGKNRRPLSRSRVSRSGPGFGSGNVPVAFRQGRLAGRRRHQSRLGLARHETFALERLVWTGKTPFEIHEMRAKPDGFELTFTEQDRSANGRRPGIL